MIEALTDVAALWPIVLPVMLFALWRTARRYGVGCALQSLMKEVVWRMFVRFKETFGLWSPSGRATAHGPSVHEHAEGKGDNLT
jgi:hypothetical protein